MSGPVVDAYHLPGVDPEGWETRVVGGVTVRLPVMTPERVAQACDAVAAARDRVLAGMTVDEVVRRLDRVTLRWLDGSSPERRLAEAVLPAVTGYDRDMVLVGLRRQMKTFRGHHLRRFLQVDFANPAVLDGFWPRPGGGFCRAFGPRLVFHVFAGNTPGLPAWSLVAAFLVKAASFGKPASGEPVFAPLFARHVARVDPELGRCLAVAWWPGGSGALEAAALERAEAVVAFGSAGAVEDLRRRVPAGVPFVAYGHRISASFVGREALAPDLVGDVVARAAADVVWWDQQGCLSPHVVFVESDGDLAPVEFARALAAALAQAQVRRPRAILTPAEHAAVVRWRSRWQARAMADPAVEVYGAEGTEWTVVYDPGPPTLEPTPVNRSVRVVAVDDAGSAADALAPWRGTVQSVGVAVPPHRLLDVADRFGRAGATRVAALGRMAEPEAGWHHDGRYSLADLVRWVDVEASAEAVAEGLDREVPGS